MHNLFDNEAENKI